jgi:hypothetical protein
MELPAQQQLAIQIESIFMPYARRQRDTLREHGTRFVHYTSADAALNIIKTKRLWLRNCTCMSDYREVQHGFDILDRYFKVEQKRDSFFRILDDCIAGAAQEAMSLFNQYWSDIRFNSYIACISEHDDKEDLYGRLSMWRAFASQTARVAIVLRIPWYSGGAELLKVIFSPVAYLAENEVHAEIEHVLANARQNVAFLRSIDRALVVQSIFGMLMAGVTCLKHEGFHEEREWRAIYSPQLSPSPLVSSATECVAGVPQIVHKMPLDVRAAAGLGELDLSKIFDRLIIGPSQYSLAMSNAFVGALVEAGVLDAASRVYASNIPIRT